MPIDPTVVTDASTRIMDVGLVGVFLIGVLGTCGWITKQWLGTMKLLDAEKDARLADAKEYAAAGEAARSAMQANTAAIQSILEAFRDRRNT